MLNFCMEKKQENHQQDLSAEVMLIRMTRLNPIAVYGIIQLVQKRFLMVLYQVNQMEDI